MPTPLGRIGYYNIRFRDVGLSVRAPINSCSQSTALNFDPINMKLCTVLYIGPKTTHIYVNENRLVQRLYRQTLVG